MRSAPSNRFIEEWLHATAVGWAAMSDTEYWNALAAWRGSFEWMIEARAGQIVGRRAYAAVDAHLPTTLLILGGASSSVATTKRRKPFGYRVGPIEVVDHDVLNASDAVLTDEMFSFTCLYTHEADELAATEYYSIARAGNRPET